MRLEVIQIVDHLSVNVEYPVVADPYARDELIDDWEWEFMESSNGVHYHNDWRMTVHTTYWARFYGGSHDAAFAGALELRDKARNYGLTENVGSMMQQYMCHAEYGFFLPRGFHLEEWRPWAPYRTVVKYHCNPPGHINHNW